MTRDVPAPLGSDVIIHCSFASPSHLDTGKVSIYWKRTVKTYVFHANETNVLEMYRGKTKLVGRKERGDCSLMIQNFREDNLQIYLRVIVDGSPYSFVNDSVRIRLSGKQSYCKGLLLSDIDAKLVMIKFFVLHRVE